MSGLFGVTIDSANPEKLEFDEQVLYDINMGYVDPTEITPHSSVAFHKAENDFFHPWSIDNVGYQYGYARLKDIIPLRDYLTLPAHLVDGLIEGIVDGEKKRQAEVPSKPEDLFAGMSPEDKKLMEAMVRNNGPAKP